MSTKPVLPAAFNPVRGGGVLMIAERASALVNSIRYGFRDPGEITSVTMSRATSTTPFLSGRTAVPQIVFNPTTEDATTIVANFANMTLANFAIYMGLDVESQTVAADVVTNEMLYRAFPGATYPIGSTNDRPEGLPTITSIQALTIDGIAWGAAAVIAEGTVVLDAESTINAHVAIVGGTTAGTEPTWASAGGTVVDGGVTWKHLGPAALVSGTDFEVDLTTGAVVGIVSEGTTFATTMSRMPSGYYLNLLLDYTPTAGVYQRLANQPTAKTYALMFHGNSGDGVPLNFYAPYATAAGNGDSEWINAESPQQFQVTFSALKTDSNKPAVIPLAYNATAF